MEKNEKTLWTAHDLYSRSYMGHFVYINGVYKSWIRLREMEGVYEEIKIVQRTAVSTNIFVKPLVQL